MIPLTAPRIVEISRLARLFVGHTLNMFRFHNRSAAALAALVPEFAVRFCIPIIPEGHVPIIGRSQLRSIVAVEILGRHDAVTVSTAARAFDLVVGSIPVVAEGLVHVIAAGKEAEEKRRKQRTKNKEQRMSEESRRAWKSGKNNKIQNKKENCKTLSRST